MLENSICSRFEGESQKNDDSHYAVISGLFTEIALGGTSSGFMSIL